MRKEIETFVRAYYERRSSSAITLIHRLLQNPFITIEQAKEVCSLSYKAANDLVKKLCTDEILTETTKQSRNSIFVFEKYLSIYQ